MILQCAGKGMGDYSGTMAKEERRVFTATTEECGKQCRV